MNEEEYNLLQNILVLPTEAAADLLQSDEDSSSVASSAEEDVLPDFLDGCAT